MKQLISIIIFVIISVNIYSQSESISKYHIINVGSISIPDKMEIQSGDYKVFSESLQREIAKQYDYKITGDRIVFQPKGVNNFKKDSFQKYARVIIKTVYGTYNDYESLEFDINQFSHSDIIELDRIYKQNLTSQFKGTVAKLITWYPLKVEKINGMSCIHQKYIRQIKDNPYVLVHIYEFHNDDKRHTLTMSYRLSEEKYWKPAFDKTLKSFRITNKR